MLRLVSDENVHGGIVKGLQTREPSLDLVRTQDVGLAGIDDRLILEWAAEHGRVLITRDRNTMIGFAWSRVEAGLPMPGVFALKRSVSIGQAIDDILRAAQERTEEQMQNQVEYIPLQSRN